MGIRLEEKEIEIIRSYLYFEHDEDCDAIVCDEWGISQEELQGLVKLYYDNQADMEMFV